jgi:hypothetical protein
MMPRVELWTSVFAGLSGGLAGVLWSGLVTTPWIARGAHAAVDVAMESALRVFAGAALRAAAGAALGFLFWLSWGLIAVVGLPWYAVGLLYGVMTWAALAAPALGTLLLRGDWPARPIVAHTVEWLATCVMIGLLCAWSWYRYA